MDPDAGVMDYTPEGYLKALGELLADPAMRLEAPFTLVTQGFLGPVGMAWAAAHPERVRALVVINAPLTREMCKLPGALASLGNPILGPIFCQEPSRLADKALERCGRARDICMLDSLPQGTSAHTSLESWPRAKNTPSKEATIPKEANEEDKMLRCT